MTSPFSLLIKPASADCNLQCEYCFYLQKKDLYPESPRHRMQDYVLEQLIHSYLSTRQQVYSMIWQGGEPTLMGHDFFGRVVDLQKKYGRPGSRIANSVQTNATLITPQLASLFADYRFLLGCSLDGPADLHDQYRRTPGHKPSHHLTLQGIQTLRRHQVPVNGLVLVSQANVHSPQDVYDYLKAQGLTFLQFVPCVEFDDQGRLLPFSISGEQWGRFMLAVFERWLPRDRTKISVRLFESILSKLVHGQASDCCFAPRCNHYYVVEYNGDIYPCDFFVTPRYKLGNIMDNSWSEVQESAVARHFSSLKQDLSPACEVCEFRELCMGDCLKFRKNMLHGPQEQSWLCSGWKLFFSATLERFKLLARCIRDNTPYPDSYPIGRV
ncbi:MAG: anaerobic sulfatase maturase [Desulfovermiculus sp.]